MNGLPLEKLIPAGLAGGGLLLLAVGGLCHWIQRRRLEGWTRIHGIVEDYEQVEGEGGPDYNPCVVFLDSSDRKHRFKADVQWGWRKHEIGQPIAVVHHPQHPGRAYLDDNIEPYQGADLVVYNGRVPLE